ncbi:MAG: hypothetical protein CL789_04760 [Chloroflexi bacterium]|nr:hypothetical protein [Chloroflexota bacterium]HCU79971.1 hypothetical protein [Chloroflexota bacterium]
MATITILGCAYAIPNSTHEVTHFVIQGNATGILIDCGSNPTVRLEQANISYDSITDLILTHFHPDHISGAPLMLMNMWLLGRKKPLRIHGLAHCLDNLTKLMQAYEWDKWPDFFPVEFHQVPSIKQAPVLTNEEFSIQASPGNHMVPVIGLRIKNNINQRVLGYSADTEPDDAIIRLVSGADILIHEATGKFPGHSSAKQAGEVAHLAKVGSLYLIHYDVHKAQPSKLTASAQRQFTGPVKLTFDFMRIAF